MAKYTSIDDYTRDKIRALKDMEKPLRERVATEAEGMLRGRLDGEEGVEVERKGSTVTVSFSEDAQEDDIVDLKQFFRKSPKREETQDGGWHMVIPIRRYAGRQKETRERSTGMTSRLYKDILSNEPPQGYKEIVTDYLYDNRRGNSPIPQLNYKPKSKRITRIPLKYWGHAHIAFRTVSDKSHPASWILNRDKVSPSNRSKEIRRVISEVKLHNFNK